VLIKSQRQTKVTGTNTIFLKLFSIKNFEPKNKAAEESAKFL
jgi:hypothetical protein